MYKTQPSHVFLFPTVANSVHMLDEDRYFFEVAALPLTDHDDHLYPNAKKPSRIKFSDKPIKVWNIINIFIIRIIKCYLNNKLEKNIKTPTRSVLIVKGGEKGRRSEKLYFEVF